MKKEMISIFFIATTILIFRSIVFEPNQIPTGSMIPTLRIGDFILVKKFAYGWKVPFSDFFGKRKPIYLTPPKHPKRGDVIVFRYPRDPNLLYVKRVIGLPGDYLEIIDKVVYINDVPIKTEKIDGAELTRTMDENFKKYEFDFFSAQITPEKKHTIQLDKNNFLRTDFMRVRVPEGHFFVMGDNRDHSGDSREWGYVPFENIRGKAIAVWLSLSVPLPFPWVPPDTKFSFRPERIGVLVK